MGSFDDIDAAFLGQQGDTASMIDMAVGHQYLGQGQLFVGEQALDALDIATGIDDDSLAGVLAPENGAILLEWRNRNDGVAHD